MRGFECHPGQPGRDKVSESTNEILTFNSKRGIQWKLISLNPRLDQAFCSTASDPGVWILSTINYTTDSCSTDSCFNDGFGAGTGTSCVIAGLKGDDQGVKILE